MAEITIVGCGDIGARLAQRLIGAGEAVRGWVCSPDGIERLQRLRIPAALVDLDRPDAQGSDLEGAQLFYFAPPPKQGVEDGRVAHLIELFAQLGQPRRVVYLSTTGVYGDCQGEWVDETRPPAPRVDRARRRLDAEQRWRAWSEATGGELVILRVAGIYGPGKLPQARLQNAVPMVCQAESPLTNHIHSLDLVEICVAAMQRGHNGEVYNVSDGQPGSMTDYFIQVADFLGLPRPPLISLEEAKQQLSPGMLSYLAESRRLDNRKMLEELAVQLRYPNLDLGLPAAQEAP
ncbi:SDR family oxidoreductase [Candidatus Endoriftia persephone]|jgi:nucleoside-diphosphate-sugar epimerase|nr:SDR family oxidoreductase [Candidatus Endoriftia persephone]USF87567.1 SDR family oxidoreductase [Candidatus Endoriftia persephone]